MFGIYKIKKERKFFMKTRKLISILSAFAIASSFAITPASAAEAPETARVVVNNTEGNTTDWNVRTWYGGTEAVDGDDISSGKAVTAVDPENANNKVLDITIPQSKDGKALTQTIMWLPVGSVGGSGKKAVVSYKMYANEVADSSNPTDSKKEMIAYPSNIVKALDKGFSSWNTNTGDIAKFTNDTANIPDSSSLAMLGKGATFKWGQYYSFLKGWNNITAALDFDTHKVHYYIEGYDFGEYDMAAQTPDCLKVLSFIVKSPIAYEDGTDYHLYLDDIKVVECTSSFSVYSDMSTSNVPTDGYTVKFTNPVTKSALEGALTLKKAEESVTPVVTLAEDGMSAVVSTVGGFDSNTEYTLNIADTLKDIAGNTFSSAYSVSFMTEKIYPKPTVIMNNTEGDTTDWNVRTWYGESDTDLSSGKAVTATDPENENNKVLDITIPQSKDGKALTQTIMWLPVGSVGSSGKKAVVSYKMYANETINYNNSSNPTDSKKEMIAYPSDIIKALDKGFSQWNTNTGDIAKFTNDTANIPDGSSLAMIDKGATFKYGKQYYSFLKGWNNITAALDFDTHKVHYYIEGYDFGEYDMPVQTPDCLKVLSFIVKSPIAYEGGTNYHLYLDDIKIEEYPAMEVYTKQGSEIKKDDSYTINFTSPVTEIADGAVTVKNITKNTVCTPIATLAQDGMSADITVAGGFNGLDTYSITVSNIVGKYDIKQSETFTKSFIVSGDGIIAITDGTYKISGSTVTAYTKISNGNTQSISGVAILAVYDATTNELVGVSTSNKTINAGNEYDFGEQPVTISKSCNSYIVKAMFWDSLDNLTPWCDARILSLSAAESN